MFYHMKIPFETIQNMTAMDRDIYIGMFREQVEKEKKDQEKNNY